LRAMLGETAIVLGGFLKDPGAMRPCSLQKRKKCEIVEKKIGGPNGSQPREFLVRGSPVNCVGMKNKKVIRECMVCPFNR